MARSLDEVYTSTSTASRKKALTWEDAWRDAEAELRRIEIRAEQLRDAIPLLKKRAESGDSSPLAHQPTNA